MSGEKNASPGSSQTVWLPRGVTIRVGYHSREAPTLVRIKLSPEVGQAITRTSKEVNAGKRVMFESEELPLAAPPEVEKGQSGDGFPIEVTIEEMQPSGKDFQPSALYYTEYIPPPEDSKADSEDPTRHSKGVASAGGVVTFSWQGEPCPQADEIEALTLQALSMFNKSGKPSPTRGKELPDAGQRSPA